MVRLEELGAGEAEVGPVTMVTTDAGTRDFLLEWKS